MRDLVIWGCGGFGREVLQIAQDLNDDKQQYNILGFLDGSLARVGQAVHDLPILGDHTWLAANPQAHVVIGVGNTAARRRIHLQVQAGGHRAFATLVHPKTWIGRRVEIGEGSIICAGTSITTDIKLGQHVILNLNCTVGHDAILHNWVTVAPGVQISGAVEVGEGCDLGTGASIIQGLSIGPWSVVGAGSVVVKALPANVTAVGAPAKPIKTRPEGWHLTP